MPFEVFLKRGLKLTEISDYRLKQHNGDGKQLQRLLRPFARMCARSDATGRRQDKGEVRGWGVQRTGLTVEASRKQARRRRCSLLLPNGGGRRVRRRQSGASPTLVFSEEEDGDGLLPLPRSVRFEEVQKSEASVALTN